MYVGQAKHLLVLFQRYSNLNKQVKIDDQEYFISEYFANPGFISLDYGCFLFACMLHSGAIMLHRPVMPYSRTMPSILHFQGYEKNILPYIPKELRPYAAQIQNLNKKSLLKYGLEWIGENIIPPFYFNPFYRGLYFILYILLILILVKIK